MLKLPPMVSLSPAAKEIDPDGPADAPVEAMMDPEAPEVDVPDVTPTAPLDAAPVALPIDTAPLSEVELPPEAVSREPPVEIVLAPADIDTEPPTLPELVPADTDTEPEELPAAAPVET
jgi:hypothetical protein